MASLARNLASLQEQALRSADRLPPFSPVLNRLLASLANENVHFSEISGLIEKDTVLAGNILRLVNSALYGRRGAINSVSHAVSLMGLAKVRNAAMSLSVSRLWHKLDVHPKWVPAQFNLHGVCCALLADELAQELPTDYPEGAFAAGLLHEVGLLLMAMGMKPDYGKIGQFEEMTKRPLAEVEMSVVGFTHWELSARLLEQWKLPEPIQRAVRLDVPPPEGSLGVVVQAANAIVSQLDVPVQPWVARAEGTPEDTLAALGLSERTEAILAALRNEIEAMKPFFPDAAFPEIPALKPPAVAQ